MELRIDKLYLIEIKSHTVAIISAKDPLEAISKYTKRTGFGSDHRYFCNYLMTTTMAVDTKTANISEYYFATVDATTIDADVLSISSQWVVNYDDIFTHINSKDINNPLFVKPTVEEVRECVGFYDTPEFKLRKFCMKRRY